MDKIRIAVLFSCITFFIFISASTVWAMGPMPPKFDRPRSASPIDPNPPSAPEPMAMMLIGMGASGAVGYYLGRRKKK